jgi:hypothetical protein
MRICNALKPLIAAARTQASLLVPLIQVVFLLTDGQATGGLTNPEAIVDALRSRYLTINPGNWVYSPHGQNWHLQESGPRTCNHVTPSVSGRSEDLLDRLRRRSQCIAAHRGRPGGLWHVLVSHSPHVKLCSEAHSRRAPSLRLTASWSARLTWPRPSVTAWAGSRPWRRSRSRYCDYYYRNAQRLNASSHHCRQYGPLQK